MRIPLDNYYLNPTGQGYRFFTFLQHRRKTLLFNLPLLLLLYPVSGYIYYTYQSQQQTVHLNELTEQKRILENQLSRLLHSQQENSEKDNLFSQVNQTLRQTLEQHQSQIEHQQWQFEQGKQLNMILNQPSQHLFELLHALNQIDRLALTELSLIKLDKARLIQIHSHFTLKQESP